MLAKFNIQDAQNYLYSIKSELQDRKAVAKPQQISAYILRQTYQQQKHQRHQLHRSVMLDLFLCTRSHICCARIHKTHTHNNRFSLRLTIWYECEYIFNAVLNFLSELKTIVR